MYIIVHIKKNKLSLFKWAYVVKNSHVRNTY